MGKASERSAAARIEVSAIGLPGADRALLTLIAEGGNGYHDSVEDIGALPTLVRPPTTTTAEPVSP